MNGLPYLLCITSPTKIFPLTGLFPDIHTIGQKTTYTLRIPLRITPDSWFQIFLRHTSVFPSQAEEAGERLAGVRGFLQGAGSLPELPLWEAELDPPNQCPGVLTSLQAESTRLVEPSDTLNSLPTTWRPRPRASRRPRAWGRFRGDGRDLEG